MARQNSSFHGITWDDSARHSGWRAQIRAQMVDSLGPTKPCKWPLRFTDPADAARIYDVMAGYLKGPDARFNFDGRAPVGITRTEIREYLEKEGFLEPGSPEPRVFLRTPLI